VVICIVLTALDGFDVLAISFASPGIAAEWRIDRAALGIVLSMELLGMAIGSVVIGSLADRIGRRPTILGCLQVMTLGMFLATTPTGVEVLAAYRFLTGLGIGGMLASTSVMVAEYSNARCRSLAVTLAAAGYPIGVIVGGSVASQLLAHNDWRIVFVVGGTATAICLPLAWFLLPESIEYLAQRRPPGALERINTTLRRMGHAAVAALPAAAAKPRAGTARLFAPDLARTTLLLTLAYFAHIITFYFILKWIPKIVVDMGFDAARAGGVLVWANVGGAAGAVVLGLLTHFCGLRPLVIIALLFSTALVAHFGQSQANLQQLALVAALAGFCTNAAIVGLYAMFVQCFPAEVRAGGTGFVIGVGRGGAVLGPVIAGFLFEAGQALSTVAVIMGSGSLVAMAAIACLAFSSGRASRGDATPGPRPLSAQSTLPLRQGA
jgi:MFS transporter, AAHS family, vanillate permease